MPSGGPIARRPSNVSRNSLRSTPSRRRSPPSPPRPRSLSPRRAARSRSRSRGRGPVPALPKLKLKEAPSDGRKATVSLRKVQASQIQAVLVTVTRNFQGEDFKPASCLAALAVDARTKKPRLIRLVPDMGHFWSDDMLPEELRLMHRRPSTALAKEPHWLFQPVLVGFEAGSLPDIVTGPHRQDDIVARKLSYLGDLSKDDQYYQVHDNLMHLAYTSFYDCWPQHVWAHPKGLDPEADVPSLALFHGEIKWITWRDEKTSPTVDIIVGDTIVKNLPFAAHRLVDDKGYAMLQWMQELSTCVILLGLARAFKPPGCSHPFCSILVLRVFPSH